MHGLIAQCRSVLVVRSGVCTGTHTQRTVAKDSPETCSSFLGLGDLTARIGNAFAQNLLEWMDVTFEEMAVLVDLRSQNGDVASNFVLIGFECRTKKTPGLV